MLIVGLPGYVIPAEQADVLGKAFCGEIEFGQRPYWRQKVWRVWGMPSFKAENGPPGPFRGDETDREVRSPDLTTRP